MEMNLVDFTAGAIKKQSENELLACNDYLKRYGGGLVLSESDVRMLVENRSRVLRNYGRMEFGAGTLSKLARTFAASADIPKNEFVSVLEELTEIFYAFKNEVDNEASDDELILAMYQGFCADCHGSTELLSAMNPRKLIDVYVYGGEKEENIEERPLDRGDDEE